MRHIKVAACTATLLLAGTAGAIAGDVNRTPNSNTINGQTYNTGESAIGPQLNRCWGEQAANLAQLDTSGVDVAGGGMGLHSRDASAPGETFRDSRFGSADRLGIGNGTAQVEGPHHTSPADGGLGVHAINNGSTTTQGPVRGLGFSQLADPLTGQLTTNFGGTATPVDMHCSLEVP